MSVFVSSPDFDFVIEYRFDPKGDVMEHYSYAMTHRALMHFHALSDDGYDPFTIVVNFARVVSVRVAEADTFTDDQLRVRATLGGAGPGDPD